MEPFSGRTGSESGLAAPKLWFSQSKHAKFGEKKKPTASKRCHAMWNKLDYTLQCMFAFMENTVSSNDSFGGPMAIPEWVEKSDE